MAKISHKTSFYRIRQVATYNFIMHSISRFCSGSVCSVRLPLYFAWSSTSTILLQLFVGEHIFSIQINRVPKGWQHVLAVSGLDITILTFKFWVFSFLPSGLHCLAPVVKPSPPLISLSNRLVSTPIVNRLFLLWMPVCPQAAQA